MEDKEEVLTITINKEDLLIPLQKTLTETTNAVFIGLAGMEQLDELPEHIFSENNFNVHAPFGPQLDVVQRKNIYKDWLIKKGFEDIIRAITNMLVEVCQLLDKSEKLKKNIPGRTWEQLQQFLLEKDDNVTKKEFPKLLKQIEPYLSGKLLHENEITRINRIRRCLVHRNGIVSKIDFFEGETSLKLSWVLVKAFYEQEDGTQTELKEMALLKGPGQFKTVFETCEKEFKEGEKIQITYQIFNELVLTSFLYGNDLISKLTFEKQR